MIRVSLIALSLCSLVTFANAADSSPPPGAINPAVTQANIRTTICVHGWTDTVRPTKYYTSSLKRKQMFERKLPGRPVDYEEDHMISLEIGGSPSDPSNLWPQRWPAAKIKDKLENDLHRRVCAGEMTLGVARSNIRLWQDP